MSKLPYILDTNILIGFQEWVPREFFPTFWSTLADKIQDGKIILLDVVCDEVLYSPSLTKWCATQKGNNLLTSIDNQDRVRGLVINSQYKMIDANSGKSEVDTYIIAYAERTGVSICSKESRRRNNKELYKIPDVCGILKIHITKNMQTVWKDVM